MKELNGEFNESNAAVVAISTDSVFSHKAWCEQDSKLGNLPYPMIGDTNLSMSRSYGVLLEDKGIALRGTFIIDDKGILQYQSVNALSAGRDIQDTLRNLWALQSGGNTACAWKKGDANL